MATKQRINPIDTVEEMKDIEKFRLGLWITKLFSILVATVLVSIVAAFLYVTVKTGIFGNIGEITGVLKEIIKVIGVAVS